MERARKWAQENTLKTAYRVYQGGRLIGYLPHLPTRSKSGIYDIRPGDFRFDDLGDGPVIVAHNGLGPGDLACVEGFEDAGGRELPMTDIAKDFDKQSKMESLDQLARKLAKQWGGTVR